MLFFVLYGPFWLVMLTNIFLVLAVSSYIVFGCCMISELEHKLCKDDDFFVMDPILELLGMKKNQVNRHRATVGFALIYVILYYVCYRWRFGDTVNADFNVGVTQNSASADFNIAVTRPN